MTDSYAMQWVLQMLDEFKGARPGLYAEDSDSFDRASWKWWVGYWADGDKTKLAGDMTHAVATNCYLQVQEMFHQVQVERAAKEMFDKALLGRDHA